MTASIDDPLLKELDTLIATQGKLMFQRNAYDEAAATAYGVALLDFMRERGVELRARVAAAHTSASDAAAATQECSTTEPELAWSSDEEIWQHDTLDELLQHLHDNESLEAGRVVWFGEKHKPRARNFAVDSDYITERMNENAGESEGGEWSEDFATNVDAVALKELDTYLEEWADKHCPVTWWLIEKTTAYTITAEDVANVTGAKG